MPRCHIKYTSSVYNLDLRDMSFICHLCILLFLFSVPLEIVSKPPWLQCYISFPPSDFILFESLDSASDASWLHDMWGGRFALFWDLPTHSPPERQIRPQKYNLPLYLDDGSRATFWNIKNWELLVYVWRKGWQEGQKLQMNQFYRCDSICEVEVGRKVWLTATVITGTAHSGLQGEMWDIKIDPTYLHLHQTCGHVRAVCNMRCTVFSKSFPVSLVFNIHSNYYI